MLLSVAASMLLNLFELAETLRDRGNRQQSPTRLRFFRAARRVVLA
jgi:hypothetical protein